MFVSWINIQTIAVAENTNNTNIVYRQMVSSQSFRRIRWLFVWSTCGFALTLSPNERNVDTMLRRFYNTNYQHKICSYIFRGERRVFVCWENVLTLREGNIILLATIQGASDTQMVLFGVFFSVVIEMWLSVFRVYWITCLMRSCGCRMGEIVEPLASAFLYSF